MDLFSKRYARPLIVSFTYNPELEYFKSLDDTSDTSTIFNIIRLEQG